MPCYDEGMDVKQNTRKKKQSLVLGLIAAIAAAILLINVIQSVVLTNIVKSTSAEETEAEYAEMCRVTAMAIENRVNGMFDSLDWYVNAEIAEHGSFDEVIDWLKQQKDKRNADFQQVFYCEDDGSYIADTGAHANIPDRSYFIDIIQKGQARAIDNPVISRSTGDAIVHITRAVRRGGKNTGLFCGVVNLNVINDIAKDFTFGKTGYIFLLASDGTV